jgi:hypothetical protein
MENSRQDYDFSDLGTSMEPRDELGPIAKRIGIVCVFDTSCDDAAGIIPFDFTQDSISPDYLVQRVDSDDVKLSSLLD